MAGKQHSRTGAHEAGQQPPDHVGGDRINALERLVQEQHRRIVDERAAERGFLAHARRVVGDQPVRIPRQIQHVQQLHGTRACLIGRQAAQPPGVLEQLRAAEPLEQPDLRWHHAHDCLRCRRIGPDVEPVDLDTPVVRAQQPGHHRQRCGLSRSVRPDEPGKRAGRDIEVDPRHRFLVAKALAQPVHRDGRHRRTRRAANPAVRQALQ